MWTGFVRRFSAEDGQFPEDSSSSSSSSSSNHRMKTKAATTTTTTTTTTKIMTPTTDDGIHGVFSPAAQQRHAGAAAAFCYRPPPLDPVVLHGSSSLAGGLLTPTVAEEIRAMVPERLRIVEDWRLVYSLERDGTSLATLYQRARPYDACRVGFVLVVKDQEGGIFGAYLSEHPHPAPSYFGNGECFLWRVSALASLPPPPSSDTTHLTRHTTLAASAAAPSSASGTSTPGELIRFKAFPYSGLNDCYINCEAGFLSVGAGGGHYGLWLDDSLDVGHSSQCDTFGNEPLSDAGEKFGVLGVELWVLGA